MSLRPYVFCTVLLVTCALAVGCGSDEGETGGETITEENERLSTHEGTAAGDSSDMRQLVTEATATIKSLGESGLSGTITFTPSDLGLQVTYMLEGLSEGKYGIHIHENGSCDSGDDGSPGGAAGGHFNPDGSQHGAPNLSAGERHVGDLGNIFAVSDQPLLGSVSDALATLGGPNNVLGKALVIHANEDDFVTQPTGGAGPRIGCGIIEAQE